ncbi:Hypothetical predicted protein [Xyrichtys novacula]|uniref:Uncharacterized protein n=1 Tax=Xyrichtys novacula TaxID=13765 RepID=A0AAV1EME4_XYRNO|nr:Hypothetical predicted protein [Xyrichtys novacula]
MIMADFILENNKLFQPQSDSVFQEFSRKKTNSQIKKPGQTLTPESGTFSKLETGEFIHLHALLGQTQTLVDFVKDELTWSDCIFPFCSVHVPLKTFVQKPISSLFPCRSTQQRTGCFCALFSYTLCARHTHSTHISVQLR